MSVFVTGGSGFIGSRVVRLLCGSGATVRCLLRPQSATARLGGLRFERHLGDLRDVAALTAGLAGCTACIHLAGVSGWSEMRSADLEDVVVGGTRAVLEAAQAAACRRVVFVSSAAAIGASSDPRVFDETSRFSLAGTPLRYAIAKHAAEQVALEYHGRGLEVVIVNPAEVYGPDDTELITAGNLIEFFAPGPCITCAGGTAVCHVDDVAAALVAALTRGRSGERYILGGDNLTITELARLTLQIAGVHKRILQVPNRLLRAVVTSMDALGLKPPVSADVVEYATRYFFMDSRKAIEELGYHPRSAREVLEPTVAWLRGSGHLKGLAAA